MEAGATGAKPQVLAGVKVLDLSRVLAGPWCTQILADFGADVIKVEMPGRGDDTRGWGPPFLDPAPDEPGPGESAYYLSCNRNKRSLALDLSTPEGAAIVRRLAAEADILVENFKVGGLARYGLDYQSLRAVNPRLVYCSITGFGQDGPYADQAGYDFVAQAMGGLMSITGEPDGPPTKVGVAITDITTGIYATVSILVALRHAESTGQGQHIDCSLLDTQISMLANQAMSWLVGGVVPGRLGNAHPTIVPYRLFDAADGSVVVAVGNDGQFRSLCAALGRPDLGTDDRFARNAARVANRDVLEPVLEGLIATRSAAEVIAMLKENGIPGGPVNRIDQIFGDPFVAARGSVHNFVREDGVAVPTVAYPARLSETPADYRRRAPYLGEHSSEILGEWLGIGTSELAGLRGDGVIRDRPGPDGEVP
ncbi:formyl-CoA transferase [Sphingomonas sp. MM-1]|uniref:CaiB/BaiF CoA transferase family protein n=1 Tax=Sphingomonas sp. MM-1 TaxID=745310 RepID=UPI0002C1241E|nr:CoA transferase [Sphingomonas sp. MM-1]AGH50356.1 formyl-CoA transferase [Sphingomonas sp. MM-1]